MTLLAKTIDLFVFLIPSVSTAIECNTIPAELHSQITSAEANYILIGEMHGTNEAPSRFYDVICNAVKTTPKNIKVGIELLDGQGIVNGSNELLVSSVASSWQWKKHHDGRTSKAIFELLTKLNTLVKNNDVNVFFFDSDNEQRDYFMANNVINNSTENDLIIVLSGDRHNKVIHGNSWDPTSKNMGAFIKDKDKSVFSVHLVIEGGHSWYFDKDCSVHKLEDLNLGDRMDFFPAKQLSGYDFHWRLGKTTASHPRVK
ncbi:hypothetical protein [Shewanella youngdeokensis]|uniref:Haem-binding uptake Tiki superfamily ChaN domain-containing protein n=1 Tax=Shewanella youngdeokensis TaxID=2999068 RepID=A0ABZ0K1X5_9GAMM|nr:hypothetical protein RGE70_07150 [Shewanella sp. DAU334]